jgi:hypothetical protein
VDSINNSNAAEALLLAYLNEILIEIDDTDDTEIATTKRMVLVLLMRGRAI